MISCHPLSIISTTCSIVANNIIAHNLHRHKATSCNFNSGGGGGGGGKGTRVNFGTGLRVSILKPTPIIYPAFEKKNQPNHILDFTES